MAQALSSVSSAHNIFPNCSQAQFLELLARHDELDQAVRDATLARKDHLGRVEQALGKNGKRAYLRARKDSEMSGETREVVELSYRQLMQWLAKPVGFQASMDFAGSPAATALNARELKKIDTNGFDAGKGGRRRDSNPWTPGTEGAQHWDSAWLRGQAEIAAGMAPGAGGGDGERRGRGRPKGSRNRPKQPDLTVHEGGAGDAPGEPETPDQVH